MSITLHDVVDALVHHGFVTVPYEVHGIPNVFVKDAKAAIDAALDAYDALGPRFTVTRAGETEPDMLFIDRQKEVGKDMKRFLHLSHDIPEELHQELERIVPTWAMADTLRKQLNHFIERVCEALEIRHGSILGTELVSAFHESTTQPIPYGTTTLRGLHYPAGPAQKGAKAHFDRSFVTAHLGDEGGHLLAHLASGETKSVSPKSGEILLFFGVKAFVLSKGILQPLYHSSTTFERRHRRALVHFGHLDVGVVVKDAREQYLQTCQELGIAPAI